MNKRFPLARVIVARESNVDEYAATHPSPAAAEGDDANASYFCSMAWLAMRLGLLTSSPRASSTSLR